MRVSCAGGGRSRKGGKPGLLAGCEIEEPPSRGRGDRRPAEEVTPGMTGHRAHSCPSERAFEGR